MRGEPEMRIGFQCVKSLKRGHRMLRMNDNPHEQSGAAGAGRDGRISDVESACEMGDDGEGVGVPVYRAGVESSTVSPAEQREEGDSKEVSGQSHGFEPRANDAVNSPLDGYAADRAEAGAAPDRRPPLYSGRCRVAGGTGRGARGSFGSGGTASLPAGVDGLWRRELRAAGGHFGVAHLQSAQVSSPGESHPEALSEPYLNLSAHTAPAMEPRRTPICQCANNFEPRREMRAIQCVARR